MELNDRILINSTDGDEFIIRRLLKSDRSKPISPVSLSFLPEHLPEHLQVSQQVLSAGL